MIYASIYYKENKKISLESFNNYDSKNIDNDKKYKLDEFINLLIEEKNKYINDSFRSVFESIRQPNIDEIIQIYKDQEPIYEYKKYVVYIKDCVKVIQENTFKKNYFYNEFITLINNSIKKLHTNFNTTNYNSNSYNKSDRTHTSNKLMKRTFTRNVKDKNKKIKSPLKRSKTFLKNSQKNNNSSIIKKGKERTNHFSGKSFYQCPFNPESFLQLIKK